MLSFQELIEYIILGLVFLVTVAFAFETYREQMLKYKIKKDLPEDFNIEWYGPDICLKKKNYPNELRDDFRYKIGVENEQNNTNNSGTDKTS